MKAYLCRVRGGDDAAAIVFAETRGKAIAIAQNTDACEDAAFTEIECTRAKSMDKHYNGNGEGYPMDWFDPDDRIALVKDGGFHCSYEMPAADLRCDKCQAKEWCDRAQEEVSA